jgi:hypothetical protein
MTTDDKIKAFNDSVAETSRRVVENGTACCGSAYWTEDTVHGPECPRALVERIRDRCAVGFACSRDFRFFCAHAVPGETPDATILRVYRDAQADFPTWTEAAIIDLMIYG